MNLAVEALLATTGIMREEPPGPRDGMAARALPGQWRTEVKAFFDQERPRRFKLYPRPAHEATLDRLTTGVDPQAMAGRLADPDVVTEYLAVLNNAREYVRARWPALKMQTFTGPRLLEPGFTAMAEAWAILAVVDDPSRLLVEMRSATLLGAQVDAVKTVYPALFQMLLALVEERKQLELTRVRSWSVPWPKERVLRILYALPPDVSIANAPQAPARAARRDIKIDFTSSQTRAERIAAK